MGDSRTAHLASWLDADLRARGVGTQRQDDACVLVGTDLRVSAAVVAESAHESHTSVQIEARFEIGPGRAVIEPCAGAGASLDGAIDQAMAGFAEGALPVLLEAFATAPADARATDTTWESGGTSFRAVRGPVGIRGVAAQPIVPPPLLADVEAAVRTAALKARTHWVSVRMVRSPSGDATDVRLDNEPWPRLASRLAALPWPRAPEAYEARCFVLLDAGFDTSRAVAALYRLRDRPDHEIVRALVAQGATAAHAEKLVDFVPIAFGRPVLERMGVRASEEAVIVEGVTERTFRLMDDPLFADAYALARSAYARGANAGDIFRSISMRGAELAAVSEALEAGANTRTLALSPPRFTTSSAMS